MVFRIIIKISFILTGLLFIRPEEIHGQSLLPDRMTGKWSGYLQIWSNGSKKDSVNVVLTIASKDQTSWQWKMEYKSEKAPMVKDYTLRLKDREKQIFITDEGGGVELEDYAFGDKMFSLFETQDFWLTGTHELKEGKIIFEVTAGKKSKILDAGVTNFAITSMQRAVLNRVNP
jgi:hypothetical protein